MTGSLTSLRDGNRRRLVDELRRAGLPNRAEVLGAAALALHDADGFASTFTGADARQIG